MRLDLGTGDICTHLATEAYLLGCGPADTPITLLYESRPAIVIGSGQVTYAEAGDAARAGHIPVVRRISGGGAVYHGPGCLCFARILPCADPKALSLGDCLAPVLGALRGLGAPVETSARNDILLHGKKLSGTAAHLGRGGVLFHGTLLYSANLNALRGVLGPESLYLSGKGVSSVPSPVANLSEYCTGLGDLAGFRTAFLNALAPDEDTLRLSAAARSEIARLAEKYASWEWNAGRDPDCRMALPLPNGTRAVLDLHRGRIARCTHQNAELCAALTDLPYEPERLAETAARFL